MSAEGEERAVVGAVVFLHDPETVAESIVGEGFEAGAVVFARQQGCRDGVEGCAVEGIGVDAAVGFADHVERLEVGHVGDVFGIATGCAARAEGDVAHVANLACLQVDVDVPEVESVRAFVVTHGIAVAADVGDAAVVAWRNAIAFERLLL